MTSPVQLELYIKLNGGAPLSGVVTADYEDSVVLSPGSTGTGAKRIKYRIRAYPPGFTCPAGWTTEGKFYVVTVQSGADAPAFALPTAVSALWGKFIFDATRDGQLYNGRIAGEYLAKARLKIESDSGVETTAYLEDEEFHTDMGWVRSIDTLARRYDEGFPGAGDVSGDTASVSGNFARMHGVGGKAIRDAGIGLDGIGQSFNAAIFGASTAASGSVNSTAIVAAIDAADAAVGGVVRVPRGVFTIDDLGGSVCLSFAGKSRVVLMGEGPGATVLKLANGADAHMINIDGGASDIVIANMTLDGNRANQTVGVHCIRCVDVDGLWLDRLRITEARAYGIGLQGATKRFVFLSDLKISNTGQDGVDTKNTDDDNAHLVATNIEIENFGLNGATPEQTGFDCRGPWQLSNFTVRWSVLDGMGIRFRGGELLDVNGLGGHESSLHGFHCQGPDIVANPTSTSIGVYSDARDVVISGGTVRHTHRGVMLASASRRNSVAHVKSLDSLNQCFYSHDSSSDNAFDECTSLRGRGFRLGGARSKAPNCTVVEPVNASVCFYAPSARAKIVAPTIVGIGAPSTVVGIQLAGADSQVIGGSGEDCLRAILVDAPRCKIVGFDADGNEAEGIRVNDGTADADDCTIEACNLTNNGTNGVTLRADRGKILGCTITGNTSNGVNVSLATCEDTTIQGTTFSDNGAALLDSGLRTRIAGDNIGLAGLVAESLGVDIASAATSANIDTVLVSSKTYLFLVEVECETSGGARSRLIRRVQALRSGSGGAVVNALDTASTGTPPTLNNTASGNDLRISVTNGLGADCHVNIRIIEERRGPTVEDS